MGLGGDFLQGAQSPSAVTEVNAWTIDPVDRVLASAPGPAPATLGLIDRGSNSLFGRPGMATPGLGMILKKEMKQVCKNPSILANALLGAEGVVWKHAPAIG